MSKNGVILQEESQSEIADIINVLVKKRKKMKMSQKELAELTGIQQPAIARFESLKSIPTLSTVEKIAKPLGLQIRICEI